MLLFAAASSNTNVIQLTLLQGVLGVGAILLAIGAAWGTLKTSVKHIGETVTEIKGTLTTMQKSMNSHTADITGLKVHTKYGVNNSPTNPNDVGKKLLKDSGFNAAYPKLKTKLFALMDTMHLRTLYDYESGAEKALDQLKNDPDIDPLKDYAVNNPDISLKTIFEVASWVIRDDYAAYKESKSK